MHLRIAQFHDIEVYEALVGIVRVPPQRSGGRIPHWRLEPGMCPIAYGLTSYGKLDHVGGYWSGARPVLWDVDVSADAGQPIAIYASGVLTGIQAQWRYHEAPGGDPVLLAAAMRGDQLSVLARPGRPGTPAFPIIVPAEHAAAWALAPSVTRDLIAQLPHLGAGLFRSWPIADPRSREDRADVIEPLLA